MSDICEKDQFVPKRDYADLHIEFDIPNGQRMPVALKWLNAFEELISTMTMDVEGAFCGHEEEAYNPHVPYAVVRKYVDERLRYLEEAWD